MRSVRSEEGTDGAALMTLCWPDLSLKLRLRLRLGLRLSF